MSRRDPRRAVVDRREGTHRGGLGRLTGRGLPRTRQHTLTIAIDRVACDGRGLCAELLPEIVVLDDWGYPIVKPGVVPGELVAQARQAVAFCPVLAFKLRPSPVADGPTPA